MSTQEREKIGPTADSIVDKRLSEVASAVQDAQREAAPEVAEKRLAAMPRALTDEDTAVREARANAGVTEAPEARSRAAAGAEADSVPRPSSVGLLAANREPARSQPIAAAPPRSADNPSTPPDGTPPYPTGKPGTVGLDMPKGAPTPERTGGQQARAETPAPIQAAVIGVHVVPVVPPIVEHPAVTEYRQKWGK